MIDRLDRIEDKLDKALEQLAGLPRRTDALEAAVAPIQRHVVMIQGALKFIALLAGIVGFLAGLAKAMG